MKMKIFSVPVEILNSGGSLFYSIILACTVYSREHAISVLRSDIGLLETSLSEGFSVKVDFSCLIENDLL